MATGLIAINLIPLGNGVNADASTIETSDAVNALIEKGEDQQWWQFLTHIVPTSMVEPFVEGDILQIIFLAVIFGVALNAVGRIGAPILDLVQRRTKVIFKILSYIMKLAPLGAFGAMAYAIGKYGISTLTSLGGLIALFYLTSAFFVLVVLGSVMGYLKLNIFKLLRYLKEELLLIVGTSTAEPALPGLMRKMEHAGAKKSVVGLVVPTGYSLQPGRRRDLPVPGRRVHRPGHQHEPDHHPADRPDGHHAAHLQGRRRRRRRRVHRPGRHPVHRRHHPGRRHHADLRHRQVHVRVPRPGQLHRQRRRHPVRRQVGQGPRRRPGPQGPEQGRRCRTCPTRSTPPRTRCRSRARSWSAPTPPTSTTTNTHPNPNTPSTRWPRKSPKPSMRRPPRQSLQMATANPHNGDVVSNGQHHASAGRAPQP